MSGRLSAGSGALAATHARSPADVATSPRVVPRGTPTRDRLGSTPFPSTRRWLRGRIIDRLRDAADGIWVTFEEPIGKHPVEAVREELIRLHAEHMLELATGDPFRGRL